MSIPFEHLEGKYEILEKMREGGMGAVYKVNHRLLDEVRVIKVMKPQLADDKVLRERFLREAKTAIRLRHRNLAQIFDFAMDDDGTSFIVMEFIDGFSLQDLLKSSGPPSLGLALEVADQALDVVGYLHRKQVVHRDISPDNLLLTRDDDGGPLVKVIDLGIAKASEMGEGLTRTGTFLGKVRYCSPEHFRTHEGVTVDRRSDLYSFGIVLYELITGSYPIQGRSTSGMIAGHLVKPPLEFAETDPDDLLPEDLRAALLVALEKQPESRYQDAAAFRDRLEPIRARFAVASDEIRRLFAPAAVARMPVSKPGSTQGHIDRHFGMAPTPVPESGPTAVTPRSTAVSAATQAAPAPSAPAVPEQRATPSIVFSREAVQPQVRALLLGADKLVELHHYDEARLQLATALDLDPDNAEAQRLLAAVEAADSKRQALRTEAAAEIDMMIEAGRLDEARRLLDAATNRLGPAGVLEEVQARLDAAVREIDARAARAADLVASARQLMQRESFREAIDQLCQALDAVPEHPEARAALSEAEAGLREHLKQQRRIQEIANTCAAIAEHLEKGAFHEAERALDLAQKLYGEERAFSTLYGQLDELRVDAQAAACASLLGEAAEHVREHRFDRAVECLDQAETLQPGNEEAATLREEARAGLERQEEERRRAEAIAAAVSGVERLIMAGRLETAYSTLDEIVERHGGFDQVEQLRGSIEQQRADRKQREAETRALLDETRKLAGEGRFSAAEEALNSARTAEEDHPELHGLIAEAEAELRRRAREHRRQQDTSQAVASVTKTLGKGQIAQARRELEVAERLLGRQHAFDELHRRLEKAEITQRQAEVQRLLHQALGQQASFQEVIATLEKALDIDPDNIKVQEILAETRGALARYEQERLAAAVAEVMAEVDRLILAGQLPEAVKRIDAAVEELGDFKEARLVRHRLSKTMAEG